jgi:hypothetical protein
MRVGLVVCSSFEEVIIKIGQCYLEMGVNPNQGASEYQIIKRVGNIEGMGPVSLGGLWGNIVNQGTANLTLTINWSLDNNQTSLYSGNPVTFVVGGANVTSLIVVPDGEVEFLIPYSGGVGPYFQFASTLGSRGLIGLVFWHGTVDPKLGILGLP